MTWENSLAGLLVGLLVGATGVGGGAVMTPLLVLLLGVAPHTAVGTDLIYASITKMFGAGVHSVQRRVDWPVVGRLALGSLPAALLTLAWLHGQDERGPGDALILRLLGVVLVLTALAMIGLPWLTRRVQQTPVPHDGWRRVLQPIGTVLAGAVLGVLVTLTSIGAGALGAVMLVLLHPLRLTASRLVATDLAHAIPLALIAGAGHLMLGHVDFTLLGWLLLGSIPGVWLGAHFGGKLPDRILRVVIAVVLGLIGLRLYYR